MFLEAYAFIPQSTIADLMNCKGVLVLYEEQDLFGSAELLMQVHDSIVFQVPTSVPWRVHAQMLLRLKDSLESSLVSQGRIFNIPISCQMRVKHLAQKVSVIDLADLSTLADNLKHEFTKQSNG